ncbi:MAG: FtsX-like permease family protein [Niabella sp.]
MHFLFAWRYFKAKKSTNVINIIAWVCITAIVVGTAALIVVLSVFNGFEGLVKSLYASFYTDLRVSPASGKFMVLTQEQINQLHGINGIKNFSLVVEEKGILQNGDNQKLAYLKGVDSNYRYAAGVVNCIYDGKYDIGTAESPKLILGAGIAASLGSNASLTDYPLMIYVPRKSDSEMFDEVNNITSDSIHLAASFLIQQDFDDKYAITNIDFLRAAMSLPDDNYSGLEIAVSNPAQTEKIKKQLQTLLGASYKVQNRYEQNQSLYSIMNMERWVFYAILCLILVVAAFNMVGALTMLVLEKRKDISVLHALGADSRFIQRVFLNEGFLLAIIGGGIGMFIALGMVLLQQRFHLISLQGGSFVVDYFPVTLRVTDFILVGVTVLVIAFVASYVPARKASRQDFSLRSE